MKVKTFSMAVILGLLLPVILGVQPAMAVLDWPDAPLITDPSDAWVSIDILKVYVTHDSENLTVDVQGSDSLGPYDPPYAPYIMNNTQPGEWIPSYTECFIHLQLPLNDLEVTVWDNNPSPYSIQLQSTHGSVQAPCTVKIPLTLLEGATQIDIYVETIYKTDVPWVSDYDRAPDTSYVTYTLNEAPEINSVTVDPPQLWPPNNKPRDVVITVDATDPNGPEDIVRTTYSVDDEYEIYNVPETDLPNDGIISLIAERDEADEDGRVYTVTVIVYDSGEFSDSSSVDVIVPHDRGKSGK